MSPRLAFLIFLFGIAPVLPAQSPTSGGTPPPEVVVRELVLTVGKALLIESASPVLRISIGNGEIAEAVPVAPREVVINGKAAGQTNLILWDQGGNKRLFDIKVRPPMLEAARRQLAGVLKDQDVTLELEGDSVFVRGTVKDLVSAERAMAIAGTLGKPVNLLDVVVPPVEAQILLKVRFANVDRGATSELGANIMSMGKMPARGTTGQFSPPAPQDSSGAGTSFTFSDALNIFLFRPDLNLASTIRALQAKSLVEILAEPNVLTVDGKRASFLAGGEFPFPTLQGGGGGIGQVTVQFREFGIRLSFLP